MSKPKLRFEITFVPNWRTIELVRGSIGSISEAVIDVADTRAAMSMVSAELLENAFKHGEGKTAVDYSLQIDGPAISVSVSNSWPADSNENIDNLVEAIDWVEGFDNPLDAYIEKMKTLYESEDVEESGLGLVRIVYEGQCALDCTLDREARRVVVNASFSPREETA